MWSKLGTGRVAGAAVVLSRQAYVRAKVNSLLLDDAAVALMLKRRLPQQLLTITTWLGSTLNHDAVS